MITPHLWAGGVGENGNGEQKTLDELWTRGLREPTERKLGPIPARYARHPALGFVGLEF